MPYTSNLYFLHADHCRVELSSTGRGDYTPSAETFKSIIIVPLPSAPHLPSPLPAVADLSGSQHPHPTEKERKNRTEDQKPTKATTTKNLGVGRGRGRGNVKIHERSRVDRIQRKRKSGRQKKFICLYIYAYISTTTIK